VRREARGGGDVVVRVFVFVVVGGGVEAG